MTQPKSRKRIPFFVVSTASSKKEAERIARQIFEKKLAACVNIIYPATSFFWWKGKQEKAREAVLLIKTLSNQFGPLETLIRRAHSYEVPEVIGWPIQKVSKPYFRWLCSSVTR